MLVKTRILFWLVLFGSWLLTLHIPQGHQGRSPWHLALLHLPAFSAISLHIRENHYQSSTLWSYRCALFCDFSWQENGVIIR
jgi:hypothetical protein